MAPKPAKYRAKVCIIDGHRFASKKEGRRYQELCLLARGKAITGLQLQVPFILAPAVVLQGRKKPALKYIADFVYEEGGRQVIEDVKGMQTPAFRIKLHLMAVQGHEVTII